MERPDLEYGKFYHIYNRGYNNRNLFERKEDYEQFLFYYKAFICSVADTYAWCMLKNHFHFFVRIKHENEIGFLNSNYAKSEDVNLKWKTHFPDIQTSKYQLKPNPRQQFQHLFDAYARWFNIRQECEGRLFERHFERIEVDNMIYFNNLVAYIHNNPVKHGFVSEPYDYKWSSYLHLVSDQATALMRSEVMNYFNNISNYKLYHSKPVNEIEDPIKNWIIE